MDQQLYDAIESARTAEMHRPFIHDAKPQRNHSFEMVRVLVLAVLQELPSETTVGEIVDELNIANNQTERR